MKSPDPTPYLLTIIQISAILFSLQLRVTFINDSGLSFPDKL
uniref:Uncharacterized protein n=1 Tax=Anguilla anguilla TaxID=7936 RepID=A0A0E9PGN9_ANGAN